MEPLIKTSAPLRRLPQGPSPEKDVMSIYAEIKSSLTEGMSPGDAADHLQMLTKIQREHPGTTASAAAKKLKGYLFDALPGEYRLPTLDTPTSEGWSIGATRERYRAAKTVQRETKKFTGSETPS